MASVNERVEFVRRPEGAAEARGQIARGVIPAAVKVRRQTKGSLAFSSMMSGHDENARDPVRRMPERVEEEAEVLFRHIRQFAEAAGGTLSDIIDITLYVMFVSEVSPENIGLTHQINLFYGSVCGLKAIEAFEFRRQAEGWEVVCEQSGPKVREQIMPQSAATARDKSPLRSRWRGVPYSRTFGPDCS